jgi:hypothetical protein
MQETLPAPVQPVAAGAQGQGGWSRRGVVLVCTAGAAVTLVLILLSPAYGITFDERARHHHGERVLEFLRGGLGYDDFPADDSGGHLYGALFDTSAAWLHERLHGNLWIERHYLGAAFAGIGLIATGLLALRLTSATVGLLAVALLAMSPQYVGHAMNNPKDIPFAALCMVSLLAFTLARPAPPFLSWSRAVLLGLALALPLNVRPGGLLYFVYFGGVLAMMVILARAWALPTLVTVVARYALVVVLGLTIGTVFWPWAQVNPIVRPFVALSQSAQFPWRGDVLFDGREVATNALPWSYLPLWIVITTPPVVLCGLLWAAGATVVARPRERWWRVGLWAVALGPIAVIILRHSPVYDGWRQLLFVYPPLVILAASGWRDVIVSSRKQPIVSGVVLAGLLLGCAEPLLYMVRSHPNEAVYFNACVRGPRGAFRRFELDYWGNSLLQASAWTAGVAERSGVRLKVSGWPYPLVREDVLRFPSLIPTEPDAETHHIEVRLLRDSREGLRRTMSRHDILHVVRTGDGAPLAVVLPGPGFEEIQGLVSGPDRGDVLP